MGIIAITIGQVTKGIIDIELIAALIVVSISDYRDINTTVTRDRFFISETDSDVREVIGRFQSFRVERDFAN